MLPTIYKNKINIFYAHTTPFKLTQSILNKSIWPNIKNKSIIHTPKKESRSLFEDKFSNKILGIFSVYDLK